MITLTCDHCREFVEIESSDKCAWNGAVANLITNNGMLAEYNSYECQALLLCKKCAECLRDAERKAKEVGEKRAREEFMRRFGKDD